MHNIITMAFKDLTLIRRDLLGLFFIVGFPVLMGVFFGAISGSFGNSSSKMTIAVVDEDHSEMSDKFVSALKETGNVKIYQPGEAETKSWDRDAAMKRVRTGKLVGVIMIPQGFGETAGMFWEEGKPVQVGIDPSRQAEAGMLQGLIMQSAGQLAAERFRDPRSIRPALQKAKEQLSKSENVSPVLRPLLSQMMQSFDSAMSLMVQVQEQGRENGGQGTPGMQLAKIQMIDVSRKPPPGSTAAAIDRLASRTGASKWDLSFPQAMMWGVLACSAGFAITLVREQKQGTLLRLQVAPVTRGHVLAGKATACFIAVIGVIGMMVLLGLALKMRPESPGLLLLAAVSNAVCFVGIMILMSVIGKTEEAVSGAAWGINVMMAMFGGGMVPQMFMPQFMKTLSQLSPVKWGIQALEGAIWRGYTLPEMMVPCGVLFGIGALGLISGVWIMSKRNG